MNIIICIGSSCHLKGSRQIVESLQALIEKHQLQGQIKLSGTFCMGKCMEGVCTTVDGVFYSLKPETVSSFFETTVLPQVNATK